jgi:hypothetical protein
MSMGVKQARPLSNFRLLLTFENGEQRVFDVTPYLAEGVFRELRNEAQFNTVHVSFDTVEWANGADLCPEILYHESVPVEASGVGTSHE